MKVVIQRVLEASVKIDGKINGEIKKGFMILAGFVAEDTKEDLTWTAGKISGLRIFDDKDGVMNLSLKDVDGDILLISQFTLHALTKKGNRPSYVMAAKPEIAEPLYESFIKILDETIGKKVQTGIFGADMKVSLINDGPVTIIIDSKNRL